MIDIAATTAVRARQVIGYIWRLSIILQVDCVIFAWEAFFYLLI